MKNKDLKKYLDDFLNQSEVALIKMYRQLKPHGDIIDYLNTEEQQNGLKVSINEDEEFENPYYYDEKRVYPPEVVVEAIKRQYNNFNEKWIQMRINANDVSIVVVIPKLFGDKQMVDKNNVSVEKNMNKVGYFLSISESECTDINNPFGSTWTVMKFEPYHTINIADEIREYSSYIIHATPKNNVPMIIRDGIKPNASNNRYKYPPRVYFMYAGQDDILSSDVKRFVRALSSVSKKDDYSLITVDPALLPETIRFYHDPFQPQAFFTYQKIPASAIVTNKCFADYNKFSPFV